MPEKKDDLAELIERIEITLSMREKLEDYQGEYDKEFEVLKKNCHLSERTSGSKKDLQKDS